MKRPTLSVTLCNYNHAAYLGRALTALVSQSRPPDELIILDDGSTDNSLEIIERFAREHVYIRVLRNDRNRGLLFSIPRVLEAVTGDYLYFASADDFVEPGFFAGAMDLAAAYPMAGIILAQVRCIRISDGYEQIAAATRWTKPLYASPEVFRTEFVEVEHPTLSLSPATIYRWKSLLEVGGLRTELGSWCDTFAVHAIAYRFGAAYLPQVGATFNVRTTSFSESIMKRPTAVFDILARAAQLMRSPEFQDYFSADYVRRWERRYRESIIASQDEKLSRSLLEAQLLVEQQLQGRGVVAGFARVCFWVLLKSAWRVGRFALRFTLDHYRPDVGDSRHGPA